MKAAARNANPAMNHLYTTESGRAGCNPDATIMVKANQIREQNKTKNKAIDTVFFILTSILLNPGLFAGSFLQ